MYVEDTVMKTLWVLTEERPREEVLSWIIKRTSEIIEESCVDSDITIEPIFKDNKFYFEYLVKGLSINNIQEIRIIIVSGKSSFVDYLVFVEEERPDKNSIPLLAIEETKTDDSESRNTGVYQRASKFVYIDFYYPDIEKVMFYNLKVEQKEEATLTSVFGTKMLVTIGVKIIGKKLEGEILKPFKDLDELIELKNKMPEPYYGVPIKLRKAEDTIFISGRLIKSGSLSHDPNIGALALIAKNLRVLGWDKAIVITHHGLEQKHLGNNKFVKISNKLGIGLSGLSIPSCTFNELYWYYEERSEKLVTILLHVLILYEMEGVSVIYENHAGCEKGYLYGPDGAPLQIKKYQEGRREEYKKGNKKLIVQLPDLVIFLANEKELISIEGERSVNMEKGLIQLEGFSNIEREELIPLYEPESLEQYLCLYGDSEVQDESRVALTLYTDGTIHIPESKEHLFNKIFRNYLVSK